MNFLAHAYLAGEDDHAIVGQFLGDFLTRGWEERLPEEVVREVRLHQKIDSFADRHPIGKRTRRLFPEKFRRYSGILVDMFYDHALALDWDEHSETPLPEFAAGVYAALERNRELLGPRLEVVLPRIKADDWLTRYRDPEGIAQALVGISRRLSFENPLPEAGPLLGIHLEAIRRDFREFFPELILTTERWRASNE